MVYGAEFSGQDIILMLGGFAVQGTIELHERLEGSRQVPAAPVSVRAPFWVIVTQIVVLDAVFSLDTVITAVGMVDELTP